MFKVRALKFKYFAEREIKNLRERERERKRDREREKEREQTRDIWVLLKTIKNLCSLKTTKIL